MLWSARKPGTLLRVNRAHSLAWGLQDCAVFGPGGNNGLVNLANPQQKPALSGTHPGNWIAAPEPMIYNPNGAIADLWWNIPSAANVNYAAGSVSVFVKFIPFTWLASGAAALYGKITAGNSEICCLLGNTGNINFIYLGEVFDNAAWTTNWVLNTPSTFALSRSGVGNASLYANGKSIGTAIATGVAHETQPMELGTWAANGLGTNNGYLCFYTWVGRALTAAEVLQLQFDPYCFLQPVFEPALKPITSINLTLAGDEGSFTISGQSAGLTVGLPAAEGAFVISGKPSSSAVALSIRGVEGAFTINGPVATLTYTPVGGDSSGMRRLALQKAYELAKENERVAAIIQQITGDGEVHVRVVVEEDDEGLTSYDMAHLRVDVDDDLDVDDAEVMSVDIDDDSSSTVDGDGMRVNVEEDSGRTIDDINVVVEGDPVLDGNVNVVVEDASGGAVDDGMSLVSVVVEGDNPDLSIDRNIDGSTETVLPDGQVMVTFRDFLQKN